MSDGQTIILTLLSIIVMSVPASGQIPTEGGLSVMDDGLPRVISLGSLVFIYLGCIRLGHRYLTV
jgi:hypothetical protein